MRKNRSGLNFYVAAIGAMFFGMPLTTIASEVSIQCDISVERSLGDLLTDRFTDSLRIDIIERSQHLSISGEGMNFRLTIDSHHHFRTRHVANNSNQNEWKISRTDERGVAISTRRIAIDRNTGKIIYVASLRRQDGTLPPMETALSGECKAIETVKRRF